tara:strand:+ start:1964 stop:2152 length:189 start_codon:yes stop_codon:yes gene_type:complete
MNDSSGEGNKKEQFEKCSELSCSNTASVDVYNLVALMSQAINLRNLLSVILLIILKNSMLPF